MLEASLAGSEVGLSGVIHLWSLDAAPSDALTPDALVQAEGLSCGSALHVLQALVKDVGGSPARMWLVTRGAVAVDAEPSPMNVAQASLWGFGRVLGLEHPEAWGGLVDLGPEPADEAATALLAEVWDSQGEDQVALRGANCYAARLVRQRSPELGGIAPRADGSYLITGGLGALGLAVARWLVRRGARHLVLTGRRGAPPEARGALEELERLGAAVTVARADVTSEQDMAKVLDDVATSGAPLRGVVHAAGVLDDGTLLRQPWEHFARVLAPKVAGGWNLHALTRGMRLDFFVLFSSATSLLGAPGQGSYAAANAFLDSLAHARREQGLPGLSVNWGPWAGAGMAASVDERHRLRLAVAGVRPIAMERGLLALERVIAATSAQVCVLSVSWNSSTAGSARPARRRCSRSWLRERTIGGSPAPSHRGPGTSWR